MHNNKIIRIAVSVVILFLVSMAVLGFFKSKEKQTVKGSYRPSGNELTQQTSSEIIYLPEWELEPQPAPEPAPIDSGSCGSNITWELSYDYVLRLYGIGDMIEFEPLDASELYDVPWKNYWGQIKRIEVWDGISSISRQAFDNCYEAESISLPNSLKTIGVAAFYYCSKLKEVYLPDGVWSIGAYAFDSCNNLKDVRIPESVTLIEPYAFGAYGENSNVTVTYGGSRAQWEKINMGENNKALTDAEDLFFEK